MSASCTTWVASGYNEGQLGIDDLEERILTKFTPCTALYDYDIVSISTGRNHTLALTSNGRVYSFGSNSHGQLGLGDRRDRIEPNLIRMLMEEKIIKICASCEYSVAVNDKGEVWSWGSNANLQLGLGKLVKTQERMFPNLVYQNIQFPVKKIACGETHTLCLTRQGQVASWGKNCKGQLGLGNFLSRRSAFHVKDLEHEIITKIKCGATHSVFLTDKGMVYSVGDNQHFQLGHSHNYSYCSIPKPLQRSINGKKFIKVTCGSSFTIAMTDSSRVFLFGNFCNRVHRFQELIFSYPVTKLKSNHCSHHLLALDIRGDIYVMGQNNFGQLGQDDLSFKPDITVLETNCIINDFTVGENASFMLCGEYKSARSYMKRVCNFTDVQFYFNMNRGEPARKRVKLSDI
jgi:alpha-tubulin suppressor-like RCC1 family protein